ncbi:hypothetical protein CRE_24080 [Caenorhabditis remanei]|uniref:Uncharacterized protein n=1 Tax=Caenorhabditis remanei TaxID=31234 RepID=E3MVP9_CAERE|nr:hypothetical protein CRE_24080 [Caenorhabditis remanei]
MESSKQDQLYESPDKKKVETVLVEKKEVETVLAEKKEVEKVQVENKEEEVKENVEEEKEEKSELEEKRHKKLKKSDSDWDSETDYVLKWNGDYDYDYDYDDEPEQHLEDEDEENEAEHSEEYEELVNWRVNFRLRYRIKSDNIAVDPTSSAYGSVADMMRELNKNSDGETLARNFQFRHELNDRTYKNKYILRLDACKLTFSERDDSALIRSITEASVLNETPSNQEFRNRNMAMEEFRKMLSLKICVWRSLFVSNDTNQMGDMDLSKCVKTISAENLTVYMDSYPNVVEILNLHQPMLQKFTLMCREEFSGVLELEQVRNCPRLKFDGPSDFTDEQLLSIRARVFEFRSEKITSTGINAFLKALVAENIPEGFHACVTTNNQKWTEKEVMKGFDYLIYESEAAYVRINGSIPLNVYRPLLCTMATNRSDQRLVVILRNNHFQCFKEGQMVEYLCHDNVHLD